VDGLSRRGRGGHMGRSPCRPPARLPYGSWCQRRRARQAAHIGRIARLRPRVRALGGLSRWRAESQETIGRDLASGCSPRARTGGEPSLIAPGGRVGLNLYAPRCRPSRLAASYPRRDCAVCAADFRHDSSNRNRVAPVPIALKRRRPRSLIGLGSSITRQRVGSKTNGT
jgi:hypothetical protein